MSLTTQAEFLSTALPDCEHTGEKKSQSSSQKAESRNLPERGEFPPTGQQDSFIC